MKWGAAFIVALFENFMARLKRDGELRDEGKAAAEKDAGDAADKRKETAEKIDADWNGLSPDQRERLRNDHGHYRD